jgi:hypothetical protein
MTALIHIEIIYIHAQAHPHPPVCTPSRPRGWFDHLFPAGRDLNMILHNVFRFYRNVFRSYRKWRDASRIKRKAGQYRLYLFSLRQSRQDMVDRAGTYPAGRDVSRPVRDVPDKSGRDSSNHGPIGHRPIGPLKKKKTIGL